ncbi:hypothetical protein BN59_02232 [Legionella massiliensis]|uniref:Uncharacterized protein n=1 Tax=Legionella massiliensis TaxID=1034943 RepID=A0A078L1P1_9GAMM|nr:hypothetical protein [Legionella massiliensis]CDZ77938.1 hypothetical protein BN59_02232 [Legionella massiliensis]CEE13676.1 hypothetical protein BN1094_02232 [Legionella massiliensis]
MSMLVRQLREFILSLSQIKINLSASDNLFLAELQEKFQAYLVPNVLEQPLEEVVIPQEDIDWLVELYAKRWRNVEDGIDDYTFDSTGNNAPWVAFAKELGKDLKKFYVTILIPTLVNDIDPNNLSRLNQILDPRSIYISKNKTWHRLWALHEELQKPDGVFGILDKPKSIRPRALTLDELRRISLKRGGEELVFTEADGITYTRFWDYIVRKVLPSLQNDTACPTHLLPALLEVIERYFVAKTGSGDFSDFKISVKLFKEHLTSCSLSDVNHFYSIGINDDANGSKHFMLEILLSCMETNIENLDEKLFSVAKWIGKTDPSLVSKNKSLEPIYEELKVGSFFDLDTLYKLIGELNISSSSVLKPLETELLQFLKTGIDAGLSDDKNFCEQLTNKIKTIYALRWEKVIDSSLDYLRLQKGVNQPWIHLAQYLAGAGYVDANYYKLLIPTLRHDTDPVTLEPLTTYPLSKYVLSTNGEQLIFLPNCLAHHRTKQTFYNCNYREPMPLSFKERKRIAFADREIYDYFLRIDEKYDDPPVSKRTIDEIRKLVNGSLNPVGLSNLQVSSAEYDAATKSYDDFLAYISEISAEERDKLFRQRILYRSHLVSVQEIMDLIQSKRYSQRECIAGWGKYLAKLVMDYAPETKFRDEIEKNVDIASMRLFSAKKVYSDYDELTEEDAMRYTLTIFTSLMTHQFQCLWLMGYSVSIDEYSNTVTETGNEIFNLVNKNINSGNLKSSRFLFTQLYEHIIKPSILNKSWFRYQDTEAWLTAINTGTMFDIENQEYFDPELLLTVLWSGFQKNNKLKQATENFLDELHEIISGPDNQYKKWVLVNIEFTKFLNLSAVKPKRNEILQSLRDASMVETVEPDLAINSSKEFLIHRLAQCGARDCLCRQAGLFGSTPGMYKSTYEHLKRMLSHKLEAELLTIVDRKPTIQDLIKKLDVVVKKSQRNELAKLQRYMAEISPLVDTTKVNMDEVTSRDAMPVMIGVGA